jgi:mannose-6-phosphate isomerase-like protein (cupin superfamily)
MEVVYQENPCGGKGKMKLEMILSEAELKDKCGLYARVTLRPGDVLGYHEHHGNGECYFVLAGEGVYDDNGAKRVIRAGDVTWTPDGSGHALSNADGKTDLVFMALIVNS